MFIFWCFFYPMEQLAARCLLWLSEKEKIFLVYIWESKKPSSYNIYTAVVMWRSLDFIKNVTQSVSDLTSASAEGQRVYSPNLNLGDVSQLSGPQWCEKYKNSLVCWTPHPDVLAGYTHLCVCWHHGCNSKSSQPVQIRSFMAENLHWPAGAALCCVLVNKSLLLVLSVLLPAFFCSY